MSARQAMGHHDCVEKKSAAAKLEEWEDGLLDASVMQLMEGRTLWCSTRVVLVASRGW